MMRRISLAAASARCSPLSALRRDAAWLHYAHSFLPGWRAVKAWELHQGGKGLKVKTRAPRI